MDDATVSAVVSEIAPLLAGRAPGKIFQFDPQSFAIDFGLRSEGWLFISVEPGSPRMYLIKRRVRDLNKQSTALNQFGLMLRKELSLTRVSAITKLPNDRIVRFQFSGADAIGQRTLIAQLTGRSANLFVLNESEVILTQARKGVGSGQIVGETYRPPRGRATANEQATEPLAIANGSRRQRGELPAALRDDKSISEQLDAYYTTRAAQQSAQAQLAAARAQLSKEITRRRKLLSQLEKDLAGHADAEEHKRIGDLLLANVATAKREGGRVTIVDYFVDGAPEIAVEIDEDLTLPEEASRRFEMYRRSKRARQQIAARIAEVKLELAKVEQQRAQLESSPEAASGLLSEATTAKSQTASRKEKTVRIPGVRRYFSSDEYEILVGRAARDNDNLTFKIAKPNDLWLHAADYPGSHVIVRNPTRKDIPHRTLVEAAQLAAHFSQANKDPKVDVHYTQRKFLSKPKRAAPGLVRMSRFKNLTVAPLEAARRLV